jgi:hypothetical protein
MKTISLESGGQNSNILNIAGGLVAVDGHVIPTRPVQNGFALVEVPGLANIPAEWSNQVIGKTNRDSNVLIPTCCLTMVIRSPSRIVVSPSTILLMLIKRLSRCPLEAAASSASRSIRSSRSRARLPWKSAARWSFRLWVIFR